MVFSGNSKWPAAIGISLLTITINFAQGPAANTESPTIAVLRSDVSSGKSSAQGDFWKKIEQKGDPLIEKLPGNEKEVLATFVWRDDGSTKRVIFDARVNGADPLIDPRNRMIHLAGTNIWYLTARLPVEAELFYQFFVNPPETGLDQPGPTFQRSARPDPLNPMTYPDRSDPLYDATQPWRTGSIARMPAVTENPWLSAKKGVTAGAFDEHSVNSKFLVAANPRKIWVYRSPGIQPKDPNVLIMFDGGSTYQTRIPTTTILDNLYAEHQIKPTIAIFVDNGGAARTGDMYFNDEFVKFLTDELLPWVQNEYKFKADPSRTVLGGDSLGGLISAYAAMRRPDVFGKVLSQSGAFQVNNPKDVGNQEPEWLARQFAKMPKSNIFFCMEAGRLEDRQGDGTSLLAANRHLRDVLMAKGYRVHYFEVYGDHDPVHWRRTLP